MEQERKTRFNTSSEIELKRIYAQDDLPKDLNSDAGQYPFTRGAHSSMYRGKLWTMRQYAGFGSAEQTNQRYKYLLSQGTSGLSVAFDLPTQMGRNPGHALAHGEVGRVGVSIATLADMQQLFADIPLEKVSVSMTINSTAPILLAFMLVLAEQRGIAWEKLSGTIQNDILKEYIARGTYIYPPRPSLRLVTDIFEFCSKNLPKWNTISISGYHIREAGSSAAQELGLTLANGITYVQAALDRGLALDDFASRLAFFFNAHNCFFEEVAKFRAARKLWAKIMRERFGTKSERSQLLRFHTQTAGSSLTAQQPLNNVVRTTLQALAAVLGGTQSLHTNAFDEALGLPTEESATLALRTQQLIAHESGVADVVDPLGGSYLVESLTAKLEEQASNLIAEIDQQGGMVAAIEAGYPQSLIEQSAYRTQCQIEGGEQLVVGVNAFNQAQPDSGAALHQSDLRIEAEQIAKLEQFMSQRNTEHAHTALTKLKEVAGKEGQNTMPFIVDCVRSGGTLGEISDALRSVFGEF